MVRRLQELRHTEQVQRAYALNCGEGATVSYEIQIRVLREFGLADAAAELLQVGTGACPAHRQCFRAVIACFFLGTRSFSASGVLESLKGRHPHPPGGWQCGSVDRAQALR